MQKRSAMAVDSSLTDVLISSTSSRVHSNNVNSGTNIGTPARKNTRMRTGLTWRSLHSVSDNQSSDPLGYYFPCKLALCLSIIKLLLATGMIGLGFAGLTLEAPMSNLGAGLWAGTVVAVSGFLGICASKRPHVRVYVVGFLCMCAAGVASSGVAVVLAATAWARDSQAHKHSVYIDKETQEEVPGLGEVLIWRPSVVVTGALVLLAVLDCILSLACVAISAREACGLYTHHEKKVRGLATEGHNRKERLYRWLGQQKTIFPLGSPHGHSRGISSVSQFVPLTSSDASSSATPRKTPSSLPFSPLSSIPSSSSHPHSTQPSHLSSKHSVPSLLKPANLPLQHPHSLPPPSTATLSHPSHQSAPKSKPDRRHSFHPLVHPHPHPYPFHYPQKMPHNPQPMSYPPGPHFPPHSPHPSLYYPHFVTPMMPHYPTMGQEYQHHSPGKKRTKKHHHKNQEELTIHSKKHRKRQKKDEEQRKEKKNKKKRELTDEQIEKTYTGLDREIAEEFIDSAMEPALSIQRAFHGSFSQDSF